VIDLFVNGPAGKVATYNQNKDTYLYFHMNDHIGTTRVVVKGVLPMKGSSVHVMETNRYEAFGAIFEGIGSYPTAWQFTGKEHDQHGYFDYHNFGARLYDARLSAAAGPPHEEIGFS